MYKGVSIIICCYNSAKRLPETLRHIARQVVAADLSYEVIVVNNASKDATAQVAQTTWNNLASSRTLKVVDQPVPGLSHAREKGIETAQYEYLLFCDDDNWLDASYVQLAYELMEAHPQIGALGGLGTPVCETDPPEWLKRFLYYCYAVGPQQEKSGEVKQGGVVFGAGAIYRKTALDSLKQQGFYSLLKGREGDKLTSGEDYEWCYAMTLAGYKVWYDDRLTFKHFIPTERLNWNYIVKNCTGNTQAEPILNAYKLTIDTIYSKRKKIKNTWQWLLMMRTLIFFKNLPVSVILLSKNNSREAWLTTYLSIKCIQNVFLYRHEYTKSLVKIGNSSWVKR